MTNSVFQRGWSSGLKPETPVERGPSSSTGSYLPFEVMVRLNSGESISSIQSTNKNSVPACKRKDESLSQRDSSQPIKNKLKYKVAKDVFLPCDSRGRPLEKKKREFSVTKPLAETSDYLTKPTEIVLQGNVASLIQRFQKNVNTSKEVRGTLVRHDPAQSIAREKAELLDTGKPPEDNHTVEYLKLDSTLSDDGYNRIAPIVSGYSQHHIKQSPSKRVISMYDWAVQNSDKRLVFIDSSKARVGRQVRRIIPQGKVARDETLPAMRIFVGTWNTAYGEFSTSSTLAEKVVPVSDTSEPISVQLAKVDDFNNRDSFKQPFKSDNELRREMVRSNLRCSLESRYLEKRKSSTTKSFDIDSKKKSASCDVPYFDDFGSYESDQETFSYICNPDKFLPVVGINPRRTKKNKKADSTDARSLPYNVEPLGDWLSPGYDIYIIALQEVISDKLLDAILIYLNRVNAGIFYRVQFSEQKISGLGDGAYMTLKSTVIACFVSEKYSGGKNGVIVGSSKGISLSSLNGSKGAVSIILTIYNQIVCFISCHLPAGKPQSRVKAREIIRRKLAEAYSGFANVNPTDVFHHIVWTGDFNFRVQEVSAFIALDYIERDDIETLLLFDELYYDEHNSDFVADGFEECPITFYPTYKMLVGRKPMDKSDPDWMHKNYNVNFKVRWYKGGKIQPRIPSWTDRILKWSNEELRSCLVFIPGTYKSALPSTDTFLLDSDHVPVSCGLIMSSLDRLYPSPPVMFKDVGEKGCHVPLVTRHQLKGYNFLCRVDNGRGIFLKQ